MMNEDASCARSATQPKYHGDFGPFEHGASDAGVWL